jgi:cytochrome c-type biogenesis protein CcmH/NrfG
VHRLSIVVVIVVIGAVVFAFPVVPVFPADASVAALDFLCVELVLISELLVPFEVAAERVVAYELGVARDRLSLLNDNLSAGKWAEPDMGAYEAERPHEFLTMSPGTNSLARIVCSFLSLMTVALIAISPLRLATMLSAFCSWQYPTTALRHRMAMMTPAPVQSLRAKPSTTAISMAARWLRQLPPRFDLYLSNGKGNLPYNMGPWK